MISGGRACVGARPELWFLHDAQLWLSCADVRDSRVRFAVSPSSAFGVRFGSISPLHVRVSSGLIVNRENRTARYMVADYVSSLVAQQREQEIAVGLKTGL